MDLIVKQTCLIVLNLRDAELRSQMNNLLVAEKHMHTDSILLSLGCKLDLNNKALEALEALDGLS